MLDKIMMEYFGLTEREEFMIGDLQYRFNCGALEFKNCLEDWIVSSIEVNDVAEIKIYPFKPKSGDTYWFVDEYGTVDHSLCTGSIRDLMHAYAGNCYKSEKAALRDKGEWLAIFEEVMSK